MSRSIMSGDELAGPRVAMILVLRDDLVIVILLSGCRLKRVPEGTIYPSLVMIAAFSFRMLGAGRPVTFETGLVFFFPEFERRFRFCPLGHCVLFSLEIKPIAFIAESRGLINYLPVVADRHGVALVASPRRRYGSPGGKHGATCRQEEKDGKKGLQAINHVQTPHWFSSETC
jgi:hypothetical protein